MIEFKGVRKVYPGNVVAVEETNFTINDGEFVCFIGTSGSGKTTALRMINRMHDPSQGEILIDGEVTTAMNPVALRRRIGYVIQRIGLMPHQTIYENIVTVPRLLEWPEEECRATAERLMRRVELPLEFLERYPSELSGGQQQRVGVIRALAANPSIVLMDEPFGALDPITRDALQELVKELQEEYHSTFVFVTHDMDEALKLADRIAIWHEGKLIQYDTPEAILSHPANDYVRGFIGEERLMQARTNFIQVKEIMNPNPLTIKIDQSLADAIAIMRQNRVDALLVIDDDRKLLGRIALEDVTKYRDSSMRMANVMHRSVRAVQEEALVQDTMQRILKGALPNVPVINKNGQLTGIVTRTALVNLVYDTIWGADEENAKSITPVNEKDIIVHEPASETIETEGVEL